MRSTILAATAAAALLGWGLPAGVEAGGQKSTTAAGGTDTSRSGDYSSGGATSGGTTSGGTTMTPGGTSGAGTAGTAGMTTGQVSDQQLQDYIQARQQIEQQKPEMKSALESGDLSGKRQELQSALQGTGMSPEEFMQVHEQVQSDPTLRSRVEAQLGTTGTSGAGTSGTMTPGAPGGTSGGAAPPSGPQPGASP